MLSPNAKALLTFLLQSGDFGSVKVGYESTGTIEALVEHNLVEVELLGAEIAVRLKRFDRDPINLRRRA